MTGDQTIVENILGNDLPAQAERLRSFLQGEAPLRVQSLRGQSSVRFEDELVFEGPQNIALRLCEALTRLRADPPHDWPA